MPAWLKQRIEKSQTHWGLGKAASSEGADLKEVLEGVGRRQTYTFILFSLALVLSVISYSHLLRAEEVQQASGQVVVQTPPHHMSVIGPGVMAGTSGVVAVNLTAGDNNLQQNSTALAESGGYSSASIKASQYAEPGSQAFYQQLSAQIGAGAFDGATGLVMVNQSSGASNTQFNGAAIAVGHLGASAVIQLDDARLGDQVAGIGVNTVAEDESESLVDTEILLSSDAFQGARGVVLVNQVAGNHNVTSNSFTLSVAK